MAGLFVYVVCGDQAAGAAAFDGFQADTQPLRQRPHSRSGPVGAGSFAGGSSADDEPVFLRAMPIPFAGGFQLTHHRTGVVTRPFKGQQGFAGVDDVAGLAVKFGDGAGLRRRHFHDGLGSFYADQYLVRLYGIAHLDMPFNNFSFRQAFAQIREFEVFHGWPPRARSPVQRQLQCLPPGAGNTARSGSRA